MFWCEAGKIQEQRPWRPDPMMGSVVEDGYVVDICPSRRRGRKILLITCQSYFTILDEENEERRKSDLLVLYVSTTNMYDSWQL